MTERLITDDAEKQVFRDEDPNVAIWPLRVVWKPGTPEFNRADFTAQADQAIATLESAWDNWATLTAAQKDATLKLTVRVVTRLARLLLGRLT
ncbi:MAG TPA: hypothetical protein VNC22_01440 [Sporichthya sp.]|jgi:hypothetical protein|nr:hypothetical protein [Sporichthya sp.]